VAITIQAYRQAEGDFWNRMGPFLVDVAVQKEFGGAIASTPGTTWWLAGDGTGKTIGFGAVEINGYNAKLRYGYAVPAAREQGLYRQLLTARLDACKAANCKTARAEVREANLQDYLSLGFRVTSKSVGFTKVELRLGGQ